MAGDGVLRPGPLAIEDYPLHLKDSASKDVQSLHGSVFWGIPDNFLGDFAGDRQE